MGAPRELELSDEVEGEEAGTDDFVFRLAGDPIPLLPTDSSPLPLFDLTSPPARPLAVSDRHATVFLAHPNGFIAVRTKELIEATKEAREKGKASTRCAQDCCVVDVPLPGVSLIALSHDGSVLAACTDTEIHFFSLASLLTHKDVVPSSSCSLGRAGTVKDFKWLNHASAAYLLLSNGGLLCHGSLGEGLKDVMENVDAVDCCKEGNHIAVARGNKLTILSPDFKEICCMSLLFQLWSDENDSEGTTIKVDSIGWVRGDSIVIGCVRLNEDDNEEGYLVQIIRTEEGTFCESPGKPDVYTYVNFFHGFMDDVSPSGVGPYLLLGYLHRWDLMVASNKKSIDEHIVLLKWPSAHDDEKTVTCLEMLEDKYSPRIDLQENGDDNVILGLEVENVSLFEKIIVTVGPEQKELAPQHILLCLTGEGKLAVYYLARISDPSDLPHATVSTNEDYGENHISPAAVSENELTPSITASVSKSTLTEHGAELSIAQTGSKQQESINVKNGSSASKVQETTVNSLLISSNKKPLDTKQVNLTAPPAALPPLELTGNTKPIISSSFSTVNNEGMNPTGGNAPNALAPSLQPSSRSFGNSQTGKEGLDSAQSVGIFGGSQNSNKDGDVYGFKSSVFTSSGSVPAKIGERNEVAFGVPSPQTSYTSDRKVFGAPAALSSVPSPSISPAKPSSILSSSSGFRTGNSEASQSLRGSPPSQSQQSMGKSLNSRTQAPADYYRNSKMGTRFDSEQDLSKKFYSINEMTKELDALLAYIEKDGGFRDACITFQQRPLSMFEDGLQNFLELLQVFKGKVEEQCSKIEDLRNKMFQVSARQTYMKGILSQSSDSQYWDIWNRQKLSPEFEVKRQNILRANQNLTNQLVELERHFNNLEMNRSSETGRVASNRRAVYSNKTRSSQTQLSSVYNALNSQLAAAEQLSECLSKQISVLNIGSPTRKQGAVTKELFESIGLAHTTDAAKFSGSTPKPIKRFPSVNEHSKGILGPSKSGEPETARRRRESLDMSLASLEPQKTTVKRIAQQQRLKINSDLPFRSNKKMFDSQMAAISQEKSSDSSNSSIVESYVSRLHSLSEVSDVKEKPSGPQQNPLFKWVKESTGPSQISEQKHFELPGQMKSTAQQSSKLTPSSPPSFSYTRMGAQDSINPSSVPSFGTKHTVSKPNTLTFKTTITPKSNANTEPNILPSITTAKTSQSPLSVKTTGESGDFSTLTMKNRQDSQSMPSLGNIKGPVASLQNKGGIFSDLSKSSFTSEHPKPAVLQEKTGQLSGVSDAVQNTVKDTPKMAPQPTAFSPAPVTLTNSYSLKPTVPSSATSASSGAKTSDVLSSSMQKVSPIIPEGTVSSSIPTPAKDSSTGLSQSASKPETLISAVTSTVVSASSTSVTSTTESKPSVPLATGASLPSTIGASLPSTHVSAPKTAPTTSESVVTSTGKDVGPNTDTISTDEDDMEEEAPSASAELNLGALGGFSLGSQPSSSPQKSNPFGASFATSDNKSSGTPFTLTTSPGQLFRPASLSIPSAQPAQPSQSTSSSSFSSGLTGFGQPAQIGSGQQSAFGKPAQIGAGQQAGFGQTAQIQSGFGQSAQIQSGFGQSAQIGSGQQSGFGQPAQIGAVQSGFGQPAQFGAQQALGSVLGSFGQSRQLGGVGSGGFGGFASASTSGGFGSLSSSNAGFAGAASGGGFSAPAASAGGGFAAAAGGGGFAALASKSGGFAGAASSGGGFGGASQGGGFGSGGGGFGSFGGNQGAGFSAFGASGTGRPPADFLTQMRK